MSTGMSMLPQVLKVTPFYGTLLLLLALSFFSSFSSYEVSNMLASS